MSVTVLLFATYADAFGVPSLTVPVSSGATVRDVLAGLAGKPGAHALPPRPVVAVNERYAGLDTPVSSGDEVALIPPVAGG